MDILAQADSSAISGASNPAIVSQVPGGAALNAASIHSWCGGKSDLATVIGEDAAGAALRLALEERDIQLHAETALRTGTYVAVVQPDGELVIAASDMEGSEKATFDLPGGEWSWIYVDANLSASHISEITKESSAPVALASVSLAKVGRLKEALSKAFLLFTNRTEWEELCNGKLSVFRAISAASVVITNGAEAITVIEGDSQISLPVQSVEPVVNVIGAGDAIAGGTLYGLSCGLSLREAVGIGMGAAAAVLCSNGPYPDRSYSFD
jgi:pseudouridine kinase